MSNWSNEGLNRGRSSAGQEGLGAAALKAGRTPRKAKAAAKSGFRFPGGRRGAIIAGAAGATGLAAAGAHHHMSKSLVNPFEEVVAFGKAYPVALPVARAVRVRALLPTGGHVSHANDLKVYRGRRSGGPATKLEHYSKGDIQTGLKMAAGAKGVMPLRTPGGLKPTGALTSRLKVNSKIPDAGRRGNRIA